jgi:hypothetical protein
MSNLTDRIAVHGHCGSGDCVACNLLTEAADEIERLTAKIEVMRDALDRIAGGAYREAEQERASRQAFVHHPDFEPFKISGSDTTVVDHSVEVGFTCKCGADSSHASKHFEPRPVWTAVHCSACNELTPIPPQGNDMAFLYPDDNDLRLEIAQEERAQLFKAGFHAFGNVWATERHGNAELAWEHFQAERMKAAASTEDK